jgi:hypothetical protein
MRFNSDFKGLSINMHVSHSVERKFSHEYEQSTGMSLGRSRRERDDKLGRSLGRRDTGKRAKIGLG